MSAFWPNGSRDSKPKCTLEFGFRHPRYSRGWHTGWDTVGYDYNCSPADGVVVFRGYDGSYGNTVIVEHAGGVRSRTAHGSAFLVNRGDRVHAGQRLLVQGTTGMSTGKHNHQEIILANGTFVDPEVWIPQQGNSAPAPQPSGDTRTWIDLTNWYWYRNPGDAQAMRNPQRPLLEGKYPIIKRDPNGAIQVLSNSRGLIWVHSSASTASAPVEDVRLWWTVPSNGQYYYNKYENALNGNFDPNQLIPASAGTLYVVEQPGTGPIKVDWNGRHVWVGTRRNPLSGRRR